MNIDNLKLEVGKLLGDTKERVGMLKGYDRMIEILGEAGASEHAASIMVKLLKKR
jgi:hypothetical protein